MKKLITKTLIAMCLVITCCAIFVGCKVETFYLRVNLNHRDAKYTQAYLDEKNFSSQNITHIINPNNFDLFADDMPSKDDLQAPANKAFAGWYLDAECTSDNYFNKTNWNNYIANLPEDRKSASIYAYWIDDTDLSVTFDLNGDISFKDSFKATKGFTNTLRIVGTPQEIINYLPTASTIIIPEDRYFNGWCLDQLGTTPMTVENLANMLLVTNEITVYANWNIRTTVSNVFLTASSTESSTVQAFVFPEDINQQYGGNISRKDIVFECFEDEFNKVNAFAETLHTHIDQLGATPAYTFAGWKIEIWNNGTSELLDLNETNWLEITSENIHHNTVYVYIVATWVQQNA